MATTSIHVQSLTTSIIRKSPAIKLVGVLGAADPMSFDLSQFKRRRHLDLELTIQRATIAGSQC